MATNQDIESQIEDSESSSSNKFTSFLSNLIPSKSIKLTSLTPEEQLIQDEPWLNLSKFDKLVLFAILMAGSISCYVLCFLLFPILALKPVKFGVLWSIGSVLFLASFALLQGFRIYFKTILSKERIWFSLSFLITIALTLISSIYLQNWILSLIFCVAQLLSQLIYTISYFPIGRSGLSVVGDIAVNQWINS